MSKITDYTQNRDYTLILDKSGSMTIKDPDPDHPEKEPKELPSRWEIMRETTFALASKCEEFDPDGITVYTFSTYFTRYENVTANKVYQIFKDEEVVGRTKLAEVLQHALTNYFERKKNGKTKLNGETILVITDGEADDKLAVVKTIIQASNKLDKDEELGISFIQVGNEQEATEFLKFLDDKLKGEGEKKAKFDIVDTVTFEDIEKGKLTLKQVLLNAIID